ncbi:unnamed protein product [Allacma fusca]|uniref:Solute carrier family 25 member 40 n=1 Tax=Allacma fusca TaxID=39272 RepID=A0A8J2LNR6_9HEXA|nr:unnamed protein product [Allacma fusca]
MHNEQPLSNISQHEVSSKAKGDYLDFVQQDEKMGETLDVTDKRFRIKPHQQMLASCTGALLTAVMVTPLDVVKIRLQSQQKAMLSNKCFLYCNGLMDHICHCVNGKVNVWVKRPSQFSSTIDAFVKICRYEGPSSLWSGLPPTLIAAIPSTMVYFVSYEQLRVFMGDRYKEFSRKDEYPTWVPLIAGGLARTWAVTVISPLELIRTKMQSVRLSYKEVYAACRSLYAVKGIKGFWLGWGPTIMRDVPFSAVYWAGYDMLKKIARQGEQPDLSFSFFAGATSGTFAATVTLPFDVVKTHKQIELGESDFGQKSPKLSSTYQVIRRIVTSQGVKGLFTGIVPRVVKVAPACAIMISSYEFGKTYFVNRNKEQYEKSLLSGGRAT